MNVCSTSTITLCECVSYRISIWNEWILAHLTYSLSFPGSSAGKEPTCNAGDPSLILGLGRSPGEGKGYPLQYSGLEKSMGSQRVGHDWVTFTTYSPDGLWCHGGTKSSVFSYLTQSWLHYLSGFPLAHGCSSRLLRFFVPTQPWSERLTMYSFFLED